MKIQAVLRRALKRRRYANCLLNQNRCIRINFVSSASLYFTLQITGPYDALTTADNEPRNGQWHDIHYTV